MMRRNPPDHETASAEDNRASPRDQRRAQALRANLKRRKAQSRGRNATEQRAAEDGDPERPVKSS